MSGQGIFLIAFHSGQRIAEIRGEPEPARGLAVSGFDIVNVLAELGNALGYDVPFALGCHPSGAIARGISYSIASRYLSFCTVEKLTTQKPLLPLRLFSTENSRRYLCPLSSRRVGCTKGIAGFKDILAVTDGMRVAPDSALTIFICLCAADAGKHTLAYQRLFTPA